ncbi:MAG: hypothetical protein IJP77_04350 [Bacteroidales bacterium]|nr:hypothetical protein [Bacteroidales bacterium]
MKSIFDINGFIAQSLGFSNGLWVLIGAVLFALLCLCFILAVRGGRVKGRAMFIETGWTALWYFGLLGLSLFTYWPFGEKKALWSPSQPALVWCIAAVVVIVLYFFYFRKRKKQAADKVSATAIRRSAAGSGAAKYCYALLFAGMLVSSVVCAMRAVGGDSLFHLLVPMCTVALALLLFYLTHWRIWYLLGCAIVLVYAVLMIQHVLAYTQFAYMPVLAMIPLYLSAILPLGALAFIKH